MGKLLELFAGSDERDGMIIDLLFDDPPKHYLKSHRYVPLKKEFREELHPRGDDGRFIEKAMMIEAATDPAKASELMSEVTDPSQRPKLIQALRKFGMDRKTFEEAKAMTPKIASDIPAYAPAKAISELSNAELSDAYVEYTFREKAYESSAASMRDPGTGETHPYTVNRRAASDIVDEIMNREDYEVEGESLESRVNAKMLDFLGGEKTIVDRGRASMRSALLKPHSRAETEAIDNAMTRIKYVPDGGKIITEIFSEVAQSIQDNPDMFTDTEVRNLQYWAGRKSDAGDVDVRAKQMLVDRKGKASRESAGMPFLEARALMQKLHDEGNQQQAEGVQESLESIVGSGKYPVKSTATNNENMFIALNAADQGKSDIVRGLYDGDIAVDKDGVIEVPSSSRARGDAKSMVMRMVAKMLEIDDAKVSALSEEWGTPAQAPNGYHMNPKERAVASIVNQWAGSSGDGEPKSIAVQHAVSDRFGLGEEIGGSKDEAHREGRVLYERHKEAIDAVVDAIYRNTQEVLESEGVDEITLYRGISIRKGTAYSAEDPLGQSAADMLFGMMDQPKNASIMGGAPNAWVADADIESNPLSSYAMSVETAKMFSSMPETYQTGGVIATVVKREEIFSTFGTGMGCLNEDEFVLLGKPRKGKILMGDLTKLDSNARLLQTIKSSGKLG